MQKYFDEHLTLYSLLYSNFNDINIDLKEDTNGCYYILSPINNADITYMQEFYNDLAVNFFSHKFIAKVSLIKNKNINIRFIDKRDMD
jgi:hypothetical protein